MLSLRSILREADMHVVGNVPLHPRSFGTEVPQDDAGLGSPVSVLSRTLKACVVVLKIPKRLSFRSAALLRRESAALLRQEADSSPIDLAFGMTMRGVVFAQATPLPKRVTP
jgi:hypothetical protein